MIDFISQIGKLQMSNLPSWFTEGATGEQRRFVDTLQKVQSADRGERIVVKARAGTGKSTLLKTALSILPSSERVMVAAFATAIKDELEQACENEPKPDKTFFRSINSIGFRLVNTNLARHISLNRVTAPDNFDPEMVNISLAKYSLIVRELLDQERADNLYPTDWIDNPNFDLTEYNETILSLVDLSRLYLKSKPVEIEALAKELGFYFQANEVKVIRKAILRGVGADGYLEGIRTMDFTDQLWWPIAMDKIAEAREKKGLRCHRWRSQYKHSWVLVDECQDLSTAQRTLVEKYLIGENTNSIFVGDPAQAIMGFAGSDYSSFDAIAENADHNLSLTVNFRSTHKIGDVVRTLVPDFKTFKGAEKGKPIRNSGFHDIQDGDAIIARRNRDLSELFKELIQRGVPCFIVGRVISHAQMEEIVSIWRKGKKTSPSSVSIKSLLQQLSKEVSFRTEKLKKRGASESAINQDAQIEKLTTYSLIVDAIASVGGGRIRTEKDLSMAITQFTSSSDPKAVKLISGHRCKGLEFDRVHIYKREDFGKSRPGSTEEQTRQETNLKYVALSRPRKELLYLTEIENWEQDKEEETVEEGKSYSKYGQFADDAI